MTVTIYHNPSCGTSRNTLAMIRQSGETPEVIEYLKNPPSRARLMELAWYFVERVEQWDTGLATAGIASG